MGAIEKKLKLVLIVIFCLILSAGMAASFLLPDQDFSDRENRELAGHPAFSGKAFLKGKYQKRYEKWLSDQFVFRDEWSALCANMQRMVGKKDVNGIYLGKDGYLLEKQEEVNFDKEQVQNNVEILSSFLNDAAEQYGSEKVSCMMIPSKTVVMEEKLPLYAEPDDTGKVIKDLRNRLHQPALLLDAEDFLKGHQEEYIYYRTDHHWTTLGAYYAWNGWAEKMGFPNRTVEHYRRETVFDDFYGTTYNKAQVHVAADSVELFHSPGEDGVQVEMDDSGKVNDSLYFPQEAGKGFNRYNVFFSKNTFKIVVTTKADTGRTLLLFKDSFANCFVPFLLEDYERIIMIDYRYGKTSAGSIMGQHPEITDVLVLFHTEKFMQNTKLGKLADTDGGKSGMEEFNPDDFIN
ncbi:MAG: DHHW family protein [Roseburia sp.]|nr:DHHW family protein [Roseburia sp.]